MLLKSISPIAVLPPSLLRKVFVKFAVFISVSTVVVALSSFLPNLSTGIFIIILNNLVHFEDYFPKEAASMRRDINGRKTPHRFVWTCSLLQNIGDFR